MKKLLVIDNFDSFTYNLVQMFMRKNLFIIVCRNDSIDIRKTEAIRPDHILISPGPKEPESAGMSGQIIKNFYKKIPILGVCLGMQCINEVFGGTTVRAPEPVHGKTSFIEHKNVGIFKGMPNSFRAARYHSLMVKLNGSRLAITAKSSDGVVMGISHPVFPLHGVQFHPESFMTDNGQILIDNFLKLKTL